MSNVKILGHVGGPQDAQHAISLEVDRLRLFRLSTVRA